MKYEEIEKIAHRVCKDYTHAENESGRVYAFDKNTLLQFVRQVVEASNKWMPIDTAPKDGTVVDLFIDGDRWPDCKFENGEWLYFSEYGDHTYEPDYYSLHAKHSPTHWMPLPPPPTL